MNGPYNVRNKPKNLIFNKKSTIYKTVLTYTVADWRSCYWMRSKPMVKAGRKLRICYCWRSNFYTLLNPWTAWLLLFHYWSKLYHHVERKWYLKSSRFIPFTQIYSQFHPKHGFSCISHYIHKSIEKRSAGVAPDVIHMNLWWIVNDWHHQTSKQTRTGAPLKELMSSKISRSSQQ